jgi:hypothetical protein
VVAGRSLSPALVATDDPPAQLFFLLMVVAAAMLVMRAPPEAARLVTTVAGALWVLAGTAMGAGLDLWAPAIFVPAAAACFCSAAAGAAGALGLRLAHLPPAFHGCRPVARLRCSGPVSPRQSASCCCHRCDRRRPARPRLVRLPWIAAALGLVMHLIAGAVLVPTSEAGQSKVSRSSSPAPGCRG